MDMRPSPRSRAQALSFLASASVKTSSWMSFCPIIGVAPTLCQSVASVRGVPDRV